MPKIKTHKATAKRFKISGRGKLLRAKIGKSHLRRRKPSRTKRLFSRSLAVNSHASAKKIKSLAPYLRK